MSNFFLALPYEMKQSIAVSVQQDGNDQSICFRTLFFPLSGFFSLVDFFFLVETFDL